MFVTLNSGDMTTRNAINVFEEKKVRPVWDSEREEWCFCIADVIEILTNSKNLTIYRRVLKKGLSDEGNETVTNCNGSKMLAPDGKMRLTDVADTGNGKKGGHSSKCKRRVRATAW